MTAFRDFFSSSISKHCHWLMLACLLVAAALVRQLWHPYHMNVDSAFYLQCGQRLLKGQLPYVDFFDTNPPLIMYISAVPSAMAVVVHQHPIITFKFFIAAIAFVSALLSYWVCSKCADDRDWLFLGPALVGASAVGLFLREEYGQREHMFALLFFPYFFLRYSRASGAHAGNLQSLLIGLLAGLGACIKPFFFIPVMLVEAYWLFVTRSLKILVAGEFLGLVLMPCIYSIFVACAPATVRENLINFVLPMMIKGYNSYNCSDQQMLSEGRILLMFTALLVVTPLSLTNVRTRKIIGALVCLWIGSCFIYCWQHKGWPYQAVPLWYATILITCIAVSSVIIVAGRFFLHERNDDALIAKMYRRWSLLLSAVLAIALFAGSLAIARWRWNMSEAYESKVARFVRDKTNSGDPVYFMMTPPFPTLTLQIDRPQVGRYMIMFPLKLLEYMRLHATDARTVQFVDRAERRVFTELDSDLQRFQPKIILIWEPDRLTPNLLLPELLQRVNFYKTTLRSYSYACTLDQYEIFILKKKD